MFGLFGIVFGQGSFDPMNMPKLTQYVNDFSQVLWSQQSELNITATNYDTTTSNQIVTVLFPHRNGGDLFTIGMKVFTDNQIGQAWKNNGLLLLISTEEKKIRIIVWYGLEWVLPDALASRMIEEDIRPLVNSGDFVWAVQKFYDRATEIIANGGDTWDNFVTTSSFKKASDNGIWLIWLVLWFIIASLIKGKLKHKKWKKIALAWVGWVILFLIIWIGAAILVGIVFGFIFGLTGFLPGRGWFGWGWFSGGWFGWWGGFSGGWGGSWWWWAGD